MRARADANTSQRKIDLDLWVIAGWWLIVVALGFARVDYTGDGLRHLPAIVAGAGFHLGEPRWLFFPAFLYALLRPFVVVGLAPDVASLVHFMTGVTVLAGGAYLLALRACLVTSGFDVRRRAAALALAGASAGIFLPSIDVMEPIFGATLIAVGLAWTARRTSAPGASPEERRRALLVAVAIIAAASLLYQGLVLAIGLLPLVVPRDVLRDRRAQLLSVLILAAVPLIMIAALVASGNSVPHALGRALHGEENKFYREFLKKPGISARVLPVFAGPPQGLVQLPSFHGFNGLIASLRGGVDRHESIGILAILGFTAALVWLGVLGAVRRRDVAVLLAFASLLILPVVRCQQYGYLKFYILLPFVVAFAGARERPGVVAGLAVCLLALNAGPMIASLPAQHRDARDRVAIYAAAGPDACWLTTGWGPSLSFDWPGKECPVLGSLAAGRGETDADVVAMSHAALTTCLDVCFCRSSSVLTDDLTESGGPIVADAAQHFHYTSFDLTELVVPAARAERLSVPDAAIPVYRYPAAEQRRVCESLTRARAARR